MIAIKTGTLNQRSGNSYRSKMANVGGGDEGRGCTPSEDDIAASSVGYQHGNATSRSSACRSLIAYQSIVLYQQLEAESVSVYKLE